MRTCIKCGADMEEDYSIKIHYAALASYVTLKKGKKQKFLSAAVCPKCGNVCFYVAE